MQITAKNGDVIRAGELVEAVETYTKDVRWMNRCIRYGMLTGVSWGSVLGVGGLHDVLWGLVPAALVVGGRFLYDLAAHDVLNVGILGDMINEAARPLPPPVPPAGLARGILDHLKTENKPPATAPFPWPAPAQPTGSGTRRRPPPFPPAEPGGPTPDANSASDPHP